MKYNLSCSLSRSPEGAAYIQEIRTIFGDQLPFTWEKGIALMDQLLASPRLNQTVASLLKYGGDPSLHFLQHLITHYPHAIDAILPLAILWIDAEMAQQLLEKGANPLFEGEFPPALSLAVMVRIAHNFKSYTDLEKCVKLLLQHQANPNLQDHQGNTPLHHAVQRHIEFRGIAQLLLEHGADPNLRNDDNMPPLRIAFDPQMKALLLEHGAQPEDEEEQEQLLSSQASDNSIDSAGEDFSDLIDNLASGAENSDDEDFSGFIDNLASSAEDSDDNAP
jgi:ankyrin repeat protein